MIGPEARDVVAITGWTKAIITNEAEPELSSNIALFAGGAVSHIRSRASSERGPRAEPYCYLFSLCMLVLLLHGRIDYGLLVGNASIRIDRICLLGGARANGKMKNK